MKLRTLYVTIDINALESHGIRNINKQLLIFKQFWTCEVLVFDRIGLYQKQFKKNNQTDYIVQSVNNSPVVFVANTCNIVIHGLTETCK